MFIYNLMIHFAGNLGKSVSKFKPSSDVTTF